MAERFTRNEQVVSSILTISSKKRTKLYFVLFLSNPKDWYVIAIGVCNPVRLANGMSSRRKPCIFLLRIDYIPPTADYIHGVAVITYVSSKRLHSRLRLDLMPNLCYPVAEVKV